MELIAKIIEQYGISVVIIAFVLLILIKSKIEIRIKYGEKKDEA